MDWYWKAALVVSLIWGAARALGVYGPAARELDIAFLFGYLLTLGGWGAVFLIIDRVAKFLGWKRTRDPIGEASAQRRQGILDAAEPTEPIGAPAPGVPNRRTPARSSRRSRR